MASPQDHFKAVGFGSPFIHGNPHDDADTRVAFHGPMGHPYAFRVEGIWFLPVAISKCGKSLPPSDEYAAADDQLSSYLDAIPLAYEKMTTELRAHAASIAERVTGAPPKSAKKSAKTPA